MAQNYEVTGTQQISVMQPDGRFSDSIKVSYTTPDGHYGSVTIPKRNFTAETVAAAILHKLAIDKDRPRRSPPSTRSSSP